MASHEKQSPEPVEVPEVPAMLDIVRGLRTSILALANACPERTVFAASSEAQCNEALLQLERRIPELDRERRRIQARREAARIARVQAAEAAKLAKEATRLRSLQLEVDAEEARSKRVAEGRALGL